MRLQMLWYRLQHFGKRRGRKMLVNLMLIGELHDFIKPTIKMLSVGKTSSIYSVFHHLLCDSKKAGKFLNGANEIFRLGDSCLLHV